MNKIAFALLLILCAFTLSACASIPGGCTQEAKLCPDGSAVGRRGLFCEFPKCPPRNNINDTVNVSLKYLDDNDIMLELQRLEKINAYPVNMKIKSSNYPVILGIYSKNGLTLIEAYHCSDVCPDAGDVSILFENITSEEQCSAICGKILIDPAWRVFRGCAPNITIG